MADIDLSSGVLIGGRVAARGDIVRDLWLGVILDSINNQRKQISKQNLKYFNI